MSKELLTMEELEDREELCGYCEANDRGYCEGSYCDEAYANYLEENEISEETVKANKTTEVKVMSDKSIEVKFDVSDIFLGIKAAVKEELEADLRKTAVDEIIAAAKNQILEQLKTDIVDHAREITQQIVTDIYENEIIEIGGGWEKEPERYSIKQYVMKTIKETFSSDGIKTKKKDRWGDWKVETVSVADWVKKECITAEVEKYLQKQGEAMKREINEKVKEAFDNTTRSMLSENIMSILMANDTYQKIQSNIACIAGNQIN